MLNRLRWWLVEKLVGHQPYIANVRVAGIVETPEPGDVKVGHRAIMTNVAPEDLGLRGDVRFDFGNTTTIDLTSGGGVK